MKKILLSALSLFTFGAMAQTNPSPCTELFFSEYIEGTSNNKALEIYNPTGSTVNLADYTIKIYFNGNTVPNVYPLAGLLNAGAVYTMGNSGATSLEILASDTLMGLGSPVSFNGDDVLELLHDSIIVDVIGIVGVDPGTNWPVSIGATSEFTLVRKPTVHNGYLTWTGSCDTTFIVHPQNTFTFFGSHTKDACPFSALVADFTFTGTCENEVIQFTNLTTGGAGSISYSWAIDSFFTSSLENPSTILPPGCMTVTLIAIDSLNNKDTSIQVICINPLDNPLVNSGDSILCNDSFGMFLNSSDSTGGAWSGTYVSDMGNGTGFFSSAAIAPGTYSAIYTTNGACPNSDTVFIYVPEPPVADYSFTISGSTITFTNLSSNANSYYWTFDTVATSTATDTSVTFPGSGTFNVCLEASNDSGCVSLHCESIIITNITGISAANTSFKLYPNPANDQVSFFTNTIQPIIVRDLTGKILFQVTPMNGQTMISVKELPAGIYTIEQMNRVEKLIIAH